MLVPTYGYRSQVVGHWMVQKVATGTLDHNFSNEKALRETQTLRAGCSKAEPKIFGPPQTPFPGGAGRPKFN